MSAIRLLLVGPLPPPSGGMANQTRQLASLLRAEGLVVEIAQTNAPYKPKWLQALWGLRAVARFFPYLWTLWRATGRAQVVHVMANSGLAWYLLAAPAIHIARWRSIPVVVNYRGGLAAEFLAQRSRTVLLSLRRAQRLVVPSGFLSEIFSQYGVHAEIVPNIINLDVFKPVAQSAAADHVVIARNLEGIYGIDTAIRACALLAESYSALRVSIAGSGEERAPLERLVAELRMTDKITFTGRLEVAAMAQLYCNATVVLNPSRVDNTPNSILEALATGVPVVSTNVGGIPYLVEHGRNAWLVPPDDPQRMAEALAHVMRDETVRKRLREEGLVLARACSWPMVKEQWLQTYRELIGQ